MISRRHFIQLGAGVSIAVALDGCSSSARSSTVSAPTSLGSTMSTASGDSSPTSQPAPTSPAGKSLFGSDHVLVLVQLNGGNDALNTLIPSDGRYRDARPTLAIPESQLISLPGATDWSLHPSLGALGPYWQDGTAAFLPGIGFEDPDRSHFVAMDRWWSADTIGATSGWLGRVLDGADSVDRVPLLATALGSGAPQLRGEEFQPATILQASSFALPTLLDSRLLRAATLPRSESSLAALAQAALLSSIEAVESFAALTGDRAEQGDELPTREGGFDLIEGLDLAARLVAGNVGTRVVVVSVGGFDTHANQLATQASLLDDLAAGIDGFIKSVAASGNAERALLVVTTEFGRRVQQNGSDGTDHGAGGLSMMFGPMVVGGIHGSVDLADLLDGDIRPTLDPRTLYTACLDWLGADAIASLGQRYDQVQLLR